MNERLLSYGRQSIDESDIQAVVDVLRSDWLTQGPAVEAFETALAHAVNARHAIACSSGTAALHLALLATDIDQNDYVIVPATTFLATANAVRMTDAEVIFADVDPDTGLMEAEQLAATIANASPHARGRLKAVMPVFLGGQTPDLQAIATLSKQHNLSIIEDACHALGGAYAEQDGSLHTVGDGTFADAAVFSFHPVKTIAAGEGGAVVTNDPAIASACRLYRNHGMVRDENQFVDQVRAQDSRGQLKPWYYEMHRLGYNYRLSDLHSALGLSQLKRLDKFVERRRALVDRYRSALDKLFPHVRPVASRRKNTTCWHLFTILIDFKALGVERTDVVNTLRARGIGTQIHYIPVHNQPYYRERYGEVSLPGAEQYYESCLTLPLFPAMRDEDIDEVVGELANAVGIAP